MSNSSQETVNFSLMLISLRKDKVKRKCFMHYLLIFIFNIKIVNIEISIIELNLDQLCELALRETT